MDYGESKLVGCLDPLVSKNLTFYYSVGHKKLLKCSKS